MWLYKAPVVELVDAVDSKSTVRKDVGVRFSLGAPPLNFHEFSEANARQL